mmetsp:Transcript_18727/g.42919  ORF Transcript_18727/g.42919 Transcript_18727/m.42919 type:complete len:228 (+) Transcript_18727:2892-3575(+)
METSWMLFAVSRTLSSKLTASGGVSVPTEPRRVRGVCWRQIARRTTVSGRELSCSPSILTFSLLSTTRDSISCALSPYHMGRWITKGSSSRKWIQSPCISNHNLHSSTMMSHDITLEMPTHNSNLASSPHDDFCIATIFRASTLYSVSPGSTRIETLRLSPALFPVLPSVSNRVQTLSTPRNICRWPLIVSFVLSYHSPKSSVFLKTPSPSRESFIAWSKHFCTMSP